MEESHVPSHQIRGFDIEEYTHSAVAAYVAAGMADVGFGVEAAAKNLGSISFHWPPRITCWPATTAP
ncbi:hypothetical protein DK37_07355 [Halomonas sp. SUBG004]|nr:hypothetical protein DK37_07355 [Halomonas sp. SUBG004]